MSPPRVNPGAGRKQVHWGYPQIAELRRICLSLRRSYQRSLRNMDDQLTGADPPELKHAKTKPTSPTNCPQALRPRISSRSLPLTSAGKATGPDGVPNEVLLRVSRVRPQVLIDTLNIYLRRREFPPLWKVVKLVLLHKGPKKPTQEPYSNRPLCMLDSSGKLLERILLARLNRHLNETEQRFQSVRFQIEKLHDGHNRPDPMRSSGYCPVRRSAPGHRLRLLR
ncbi:Uncharacterized protein FWK35_00008765, partial [Aphis craccivora]